MTCDIDSMNAQNKKVRKKRKYYALGVIQEQLMVGLGLGQCKERREHGGEGRQ